MNLRYTNIVMMEGSNVCKYYGLHQIGSNDGGKYFANPKAFPEVVYRQSGLDVDEIINRFAQSEEIDVTIMVAPSELSIGVKHMLMGSEIELSGSKVVVKDYIRGSNMRKQPATN